MALKFNTFRANRYLRSKFVEGKFLLASEATDLELEILDLLREQVRNIIGDVAIEDAWKVERLNQTQLLIKPGEAWFKGFPFEMRGGKDQLVSGASLSIGTVPSGVSVSDDASGLGKIITFGTAGTPNPDNGNTTPTGVYRMVVTAREELITEVQDPFLQNVNLTESTAQKIRVVFQINIVPDSIQSESPIPYRDENSVGTDAGLTPTNFPDTGNDNQPNFVNQVVVTPTVGVGELLSINAITGSEGIDGKDLELIIANPLGNNPIPDSPATQAAFSNGTLIDSNGSKYHINFITNAAVGGQVRIVIDKEYQQENPVIDAPGGRGYTLVKRDLYVTDDANGVPQGRLYWPIASLNWSNANGITHQSAITDLRNVVKSSQEAMDLFEQKLDLLLVGGGNLSWDATTQLLTWSSNLQIINPYGPPQVLTATSVPLVDGGCVIYEMDLSTTGVIGRGTLAVSSTSTGTSITLTGSPDLSNVRVGNVLVDDNGTVGAITAIDDVNDVLTVDTAMTFTAAGTIYLDSYAPQTAPQNVNNYALAVRSGSKVYVGINDLELEDGEVSELGDGLSQGLLNYIGAPNEAASSPAFGSNNAIDSSDSLTTAIGKIDGRINVPVRLVDLVNTTLPVGATASIDGVSVVDGDRVLFANPAINKVYEVSGVGVSLVWTEIDAFEGTSTPVDGASVVAVKEGTVYLRTLWIKEPIGWKLLETGEVQGEPTGHVNRTDSVLSFDDATRTFTIAPAVDTFDVFVQGKPIRFDSAQNLVIPDVEGSVYIYFDSDGALQTQTAFDSSLLKEKVYTAVVYWDATNKERVYFADERHGLTMDADTHAHFHLSFGAQYISGLALANFDVDQNGSLDAHAQFTSESGVIRDEDISVSIPNITNIPVLYRSGASGEWRKKAADAFPFIYSGTAGYTGANGRLPFNEFTGATWQLTELGNGDFVLVHLFATNDVDSGVVAIQGQASYNSQSAARTAAIDEINSLTGLPFEEFVPIGSVILQTDNFANTPNAVVRSTDTGGDYVDFRGSSISGSGAGAGDHSTLSGLNDAGAHPATAISTNTSTWENGLSVADTDVQQALETLEKYFGLLELREHPTDKKRVVITGASNIKTNGSELSLQVSNFLINFDGAEINFNTGEIFANDGVTPLGIDFVDPNTTIAVGQFRWYSVSAIPSLVGADNRITLQLSVIPASADGASASAAPRAIFGSGINLGQVVLEKAASDIVDIAQADIVQLGVGGSGGGAGIGDSFAFEDVVSDRLVDSIFEAATPYIAARDEENLVDVSSTGSYDLVSSRFKLENIGDTLVSENLLDAEFLASEQGLEKSEVLLKFDPDGLDTAAVVELSRNGGIEWQTVAMERLADTSTYRGFHEFTQEAANQTIDSNTGVNGVVELNPTVNSALGQEFTLANTTVIREFTFNVGKNGTPTGRLSVKLIRDDSSFPSTDPADVVREISNLEIADLSVGANLIDVGAVVLPAGTYHWVVTPDDTYANIFATGTTSLTLEINSGATGAATLNLAGTTWSPGAGGFIFQLDGIELDLRLRITSSVADVLVEGFGVLYEQSLGNLAYATTVDGITKATFQAIADNTRSFVMPFTINPDLLVVHLLGSGQSFRFGDFTIEGNTVVFPENQFNNGGLVEKTQTVIFDQLRGGAFDNSDLNRQALAVNHLGDPAGGANDLSVAGRGVYLRSADGTLWEVTVLNDGSIETVEV
jgi:hypothetical protein